MSGSRQKKQKERLAPFVPIFNDELESTAYRTLTPSAAKLYPYFKRVCSKVTKTKADEVTVFGFTYAEALKYGFADKTFTRAVQALVLHGFVDVVEAGGLRGVGYSCSKYRLSKRWVSFGGIGWARDAHRAGR